MSITIEKLAEMSADTLREVVKADLLEHNLRFQNADENQRFAAMLQHSHIQAAMIAFVPEIMQIVAGGRGGPLTERQKEAAQQLIVAFWQSADLEMTKRQAEHLTFLIVNGVPALDEWADEGLLETLQKFYAEPDREAIMKTINLAADQIEARRAGGKTNSPDATFPGPAEGTLMSVKLDDHFGPGMYSAGLIEAHQQEGDETIVVSDRDLSEFANRPVRVVLGELASPEDSWGRLITSIEAVY